jgi:uncharacterized membrane protein YdbT with pleckstrin-like domain
MNLPVAMQPNESVLLVVRRHPVYMVAKLLGLGLVAIVPAALVLWLVSATAGLSGAIGLTTIIIVVVWVVVWTVVGYFVWYKHEHDLWVVTNQRLLDLNKRSFFDQRVSSADLINVQDISITKDGVLATLFNFGDVRCQTAGVEGAFVLSGIPDPTRVLTSLDAARDAARQTSYDGGRGHAPVDAVPGAPPYARPPVSDRIPDSRDI